MNTDDRSVLVIGATGTTGRRLVSELAEREVPVRAASRRPGPSGRDGVTTVAFDWSDAATHGPALEGAAAVFLMAPPSDPAPAATMGPFIERAIAGGAGRVVLLSSSAIDAGDPGLGEVHRQIADAGVDWAVLRPSWFMQNLWNPGHPVGGAVRAGRDIVTATGEGRVAFVDAGDIARVGAHALTDPVAPDRDLIVTGPEALNYDAVAETLGRTLGREVRHRAVTAEQAAAALTDAGIPAQFAQLLAGLDAAIAAGAEDRVTDTVLRLTGTAPRSLSTVLATDTPFEQETT